MICHGQPRTRLIHLPTPLEAAPRLSEMLGVDLWIKREDLAGLCVGGNKSRLLEFVIGSLQQQGVDTLVAYAAAQSNKLRDIAAAAARCGMQAVLLIPRGDEGPPQGNRLLFDVLGADVREVAADLDRQAIVAAQEAASAELAAQGRRPASLDRALDYGVEATIAYVDAAEELHRQFAALPKAPSALFIAAGAGMTVAGLALGLKHVGSPVKVIGVCIASGGADLAAAVADHADRASARLGLATRLYPGDLVLVDDYVAPGYGVLTPAQVDITQRFARRHGMILDPVYNAKVALAMTDWIADGRIPRGDGVVFVNTGGAPAIYQYAAGIADSLENIE
jgi:1-aminocyclopropane-1-carboxylate deaminase/D-cysteine desulfhydrase-like pyridoxal-dependent ACC family enzyme